MYVSVNLNDRSLSNVNRKAFAMPVIEGGLQRAEIQEFKNKYKNLSQALFFLRLDCGRV